MSHRLKFENAFRAGGVNPLNTLPRRCEAAIRGLTSPARRSRKSESRFNRSPPLPNPLPRNEGEGRIRSQSRHQLGD